MDKNKMIELLPNMTLSAIAEVVKADWKKVYFGAVPYLEAMGTLTSVRDNYGLDSGQTIVIYFLSNAQTWKGDVARAVKKELNKRIK
jgi:hypothetical protein